MGEIWGWKSDFLSWNLKNHQFSQKNDVSVLGYWCRLLNKFVLTTKHKNWGFQIIFHTSSRGGSGKYLRKVCRKFVSGIIWYPPANFFQHRIFFHQIFWDPPNFFRKCKFFLLKIWDPPIFFRKFNFFLLKIWDLPIDRFSSSQRTIKHTTTYNKIYH